MPNNQLTKQLKWLLLSSRGGKTRTKIIKTVHGTPQNANQIATQLNVDYKTIRHHLSVLHKNRLVITIGNGNYCTAYTLSEPMEENYQLFEEITNTTNKTKQIPPQRQIKTIL